MGFSWIAFVVLISTICCVLTTTPHNYPQMAITPADLPEWVPECIEKNLKTQPCTCARLKYMGIEEVCNINVTSTANITNVCLALNYTQPNCTCDELTMHRENCSTTTYTSISGDDHVIFKKCQQLGIPKKDCHCETLFAQSDYTFFCGMTKESVRKTMYVDGDINTICAEENVTEEQCVCPDLKETHPSVGAICDLLNDENIQVEISCSLDNRIKAQAQFTIVASVFGVIGNLLVLVVRSQQWKNSIHYKLISGLAFADLLFSILQIVYHVPKIVVGCKWPYGLAMCKILHSLLGLSYSIDLGFIVIIAVERYIAIVHPFSDLLTEGRVCMLLAVNLVFSLISVIPSFEVLTINDVGRCVENWDGYAFTSLTYSWVLLIVYFLLPVIITAVLYRSSMFALKRSLKRRMSAVSEASKSRLALENRRILLVLSALLVALVILVSPNRIIWIVLDYVGANNIDTSTLTTLKILGIVPYSLHIIVNPVIYSLVDKRFRNNAKFLLMHLKRRTTSSHGYSQSEGSGANGIVMSERKTQHLDVSTTMNGNTMYLTAGSPSNSFTEH